MPTKREYTPDMGEVSGLGGAYEKCCQAMVLAGVEWLEAHPEARLELKCVACPWIKGATAPRPCPSRGDGEHQLRGHVPGLEEAVAAGAERAFPGSGSPTGAMVGAAVQHAWQAGRVLGWEGYAEKMREEARRR